MKKFQIGDVAWLVATALAVLVMAFPIIVAVGTVAFVLLGLILSGLPTAVLYATPGYLAFRIVRLLLAGSGRLRALVSVSIGVMVSLAALLAGMLLVGPHNLKVHLESAALMADDVEATVPIELPSVLAVRMVSPGRSVNQSCGDICQRLLLLRSVDEVIVGPIQSTEPPRYNSYKLTASAACPKSPYRDRQLPMAIVAYPGTNVQTMKLNVDEAAKGNCIVRSSVPVDKSSLTIAYSEIKRGADKFSDPWSLSPDLLSAARLEISSPSGKTLFRQTEVTFYELQPSISVATGFFTTVTYRGWSRVKTIVQPMGPIGRDVLSKVLDTDAFGSVVPVR